jgi:hypothetical protein
MPYTLPGGPPADDADDKILHMYRERVQEREVRETAQRILADHLRPIDIASGRENSGFWPRVEINLENATLVKCSFGACHLTNASFKRATFVGAAWFVHAKLNGAVFSYVTFCDLAHFEGATLEGGILFLESEFQGRAWFMKTTFAHEDGFRWAHSIESSSMPR